VVRRKELDKSNFDVIKCGEKGCDYWHIIITDGFETIEKATNEINKIIKGKSFYSTQPSHSNVERK